MLALLEVVEEVCAGVVAASTLLVVEVLTRFQTTELVEEEEELVTFLTQLDQLET